MLQVIRATKIDFMGIRKFGYALSLMFILVSFGSMAWRWRTEGVPLNWGIDFTGGTAVNVKFAGPPPVAEIRSRLAALDLRGASIQPFGKAEERELMIRVAEQSEEQGQIAEKLREVLYAQDAAAVAARGTAVDLNNAGRSQIASAFAAAGVAADEAAFTAAADAIVSHRNQHGGLIRDLKELEGLPAISPEIRESLAKAFFLGDFTVLRVESVGPTVGRDLKFKALYAVIASLIGMLIYITLRFQFRSGVSGIVCLAHDVLVTIGALSLTHREVDLTVVAALLTIVGYSINDTIVVFDRIRDNLKLLRKEPLTKIINASCNETLSRTILTSGLTFLVVAALYLLGGPVINAFAFALVVGIIVGSYSTIFIASAILLDWNKITGHGTL